MKVLLLEIDAANHSRRRYDAVKLRHDAPMPATSGDPGAGTVLVRISAASLNHRDLYIREGAYPGIVDGSILGSDGAGTVVEVPLSGLHSTRSELNWVNRGSRVVICPSIHWEAKRECPESPEDFTIRGLSPHQGTFAEYIAVSPLDLSPIPSHLSFEEASALPIAGLTAYRAIFTLGNIQRGQTILIPGIGGGVALFALQFAITIPDVHVFVTSSSDDKIKEAIKLGAKGGVNYKRDGWINELESLVDRVLEEDRGMVSGSGVGRFDLIVDGAAGDNLKSYIKLMKAGGTICIYGAVAGSLSKFTVPFLWFKHLQIKGVCMGSRREFKEMINYVQKHKIKPVISNIVNGLERAEEAFDIMKTGRQFGKIVISNISREDSSKL